MFIDLQSSPRMSLLEVIPSCTPKINLLFKVTIMAIKSAIWKLLMLEKDWRLITISILVSRHSNLMSPIFLLKEQRTVSLLTVLCAVKILPMDGYHHTMLLEMMWLNLFLELPIQKFVNHFVNLSILVLTGLWTKTTKEQFNSYATIYWYFAKMFRICSFFDITDDNWYKGCYLVDSPEALEYSDDKISGPKSCDIK